MFYDLYYDMNVFAFSTAIKHTKWIDLILENWFLSVITKIIKW